MESYLIWILMKNSRHCHSNPVLVPYRKTPDPVKDIYDGQNYDLKTRVDIWTSIYVVPVEYRRFSHIFHLRMWFFPFITGINLKWDYLMWYILFLLAWIGLCTKLSIYKVPPNAVIWCCQSFGYQWQTFMLIWVIWYNNCLKVSHRIEINDPSNMKLATSLISF